jgi:hypothetical protein
MFNISIVVCSNSSYQKHRVNEKYIAKTTERESTPKYKIQNISWTWAFEARFPIYGHLKIKADIQSVHIECKRRMLHKRTVIASHAENFTYHTNPIRSFLC